MDEGEPPARAAATAAAFALAAVTQLTELWLTTEGREWEGERDADMLWGRRILGGRFLMSRE